MEHAKEGRCIFNIRIRNVKKNLELSRFHGDRDADEEYAGHGDGSVALPVLWPTVGPTGHTPHLLSEILMGRISMAVVVSSPHCLPYYLS